MHNTRRAVAAVKISLTAIAFGPSVLYAQIGGQWQPLVNGAIPQGAVVLRAADGAPEYVCQTLVAGEAAIGVASQGTCRTGTAASSAESSQFDVLVVSSRPARFAAAVAEPPVAQPMRNPALAAAAIGAPGGLTVEGGGGGARGGAGAAIAPAAVDRGLAVATIPGGNAGGVIEPQFRPECADILRQPEAGATEVRPGIDAGTGSPYLDAVMPDGSRRRVTGGGVEVLMPDGSSFRCSPQFAMANAPAPTPPELPADPARGRLWLERHRDAVLAVIRSITNDEVVADLEAAEPQATGDDVYKQITYRTGIAAFYAERLP